jgi:pectate lyase
VSTHFFSAVFRALAAAACAMFFVSSVSAQAIPAFSGADGAAANVAGGRGGIVYHVTKMDSAIDDPERNDFGTLRYGLTASNFPANTPRTIVFDVGGVFDLGRLPQPDVGWDPNGNGWDAQSRLTIGGSNVTFAGQTAPGKGVIFMGGGLKPQGNNNIIRNVTVAAGYGLTGWWKPGDPMRAAPGTPEAGTDRTQWFPDNTVYDAMDISGTNIMIDHVSTLFGTDEILSMNEVANNITVQYSNISQGQNYPQADAEGGGNLTGHAFGSLLSAAANGKISFHHNLYAHLKGRTPQVGVGSNQASGAYYDFRNNVFYNWLGTAGSKSGTTYLNLVNNFYLSGPGGDSPIGGTNPGITTAAGGTGVINGSTSLHRSGNLLDSNKDGDANDGTVLASNGAAAPLWQGGVSTYSGVTDTAAVAYSRVLDYVGANWWTRDNVIDTPDERIIHEARTGTGKIIAWADDPWNNSETEGAEWRALKNTVAVSRDANWDTESSVGYGAGDGMPTYWELQHGLDPDAHDNNGDFDNDGYTNLEEYLNDVAAWPAPNAIAFNNANSDGRFAHILNWDANPSPTSVHPWQPSRFDTAVVNGGTVVVDSVGQNAGTLLLGTNSGDNVAFNITAGWLKVQEEDHGLSDGITVIGDHATATAVLNLSGGKLQTKALVKGAGGTFNFTGGVLAAETVAFDLVNEGGTIAPGQLSSDASLGATHVIGDLALNSGVLEIEVRGAEFGDYDQLVIDGTTTLGGTLQVINVANDYTPALGDMFALAASQGGFEGMFDALDLPALTSGLEWAVVKEAMTLSLAVVEASVGLAGDYNGDGMVDAADYTVWRDALGSSELMNETESPGIVDQADYDAWKANFGATAEGAGGLNAVPEPGTVGLLTLAMFALMAMKPRGR